MTDIIKRVQNEIAEDNGISIETISMLVEEIQFLRSQLQRQSSTAEDVLHQDVEFDKVMESDTQELSTKVAMQMGIQQAAIACAIAEVEKGNSTGICRVNDLLNYARQLTNQEPYYQEISLSPVGELTH